MAGGQAEDRHTLQCFQLTAIELAHSDRAAGKSGSLFPDSCRLSQGAGKRGGVRVKLQHPNSRIGRAILAVLFPGSAGAPEVTLAHH